MKSIRDWYQGKFVVYENDPNSSVFVVGGDYERHWSARAARIMVEFYLREWKWILATLLALAGLYVAYKRLG
jgi:hypothetical protein